MLLARRNALGILAINASHDTVKKVARHGLQSLDIDERNKLAKNIDLKRQVDVEIQNKQGEQAAKKQST